MLVDLTSEVDSPGNLDITPRALFWQLAVRRLSCVRNTGCVLLGDDCGEMLRVRHSWLDSRYTHFRQSKKIMLIFTNFYVKMSSRTLLRGLASGRQWFGVCGLRNTRILDLLGDDFTGAGRQSLVCVA